MTSIVPRTPYSDEELRRLYPAGLQLQQVQVLMRHGERTPVSARFENAGLSAFWPYCSAAKHLRAAVLTDDADPGVVDVGRGGGAAATQPLSGLAWRRRLETFGARDVAVPAAGPHGELDALCDMGMLTDPGRATTLRLGRRLRRLYVDRLGFLPPTVQPADVDRLFLLRSTFVPRAVESLQQAFTGMYPELVQKPGAPPALPPITIVSRAPGDETLFPNDSNCRRFAEMARAFAQRAAERWNDSDELAYVTSRIGRWLPPDRPRVAVDGKPRLSGIMDTVNATLAHGPATRLPVAFYDAQSRRHIDKVAVEEWFDGFYESVEYRTLGIGGLMGDIVARMVGHAEAKATVGTPIPGSSGLFKFGLSGCHDTTLAAILTSLGNRMPNWPPFTSHIAIELFKGPLASPAPSGSDPAAAATPKPASGSSWSTLASSVFSGKPAAPAGIGRRPTPELTEAEKRRMDGYYVRIRYNDEPVTVPGCRTVGKHLDGDESFCTLEAFKAIVDKYTPHDWTQQCRANLKTPSVPAKPETAGY